MTTTRHLITPLTALTILFTFCSTVGLSQEICDNGLDDDGDGLIDLNDVVECFCIGIGDTTSALNSPIPNPSFEEMDCCPTSYSQLSCASHWEQATTATTDYFNGCYYVSSSIIDAGLIPFPDGYGVAGGICYNGWQEYVGCCLSQPLLADTSYTIGFNIAATYTMESSLQYLCEGNIADFSPIEISIFGNPTCVTFPVSTNTNNYGCPPGWVLLGSSTYHPLPEWGDISITFSPSTDINSIMIGPPCNLPFDYVESNNCFPYFYYDDLKLNKSSILNEINVSKSGGLCSDDLILTSETDTTGGEWQWFRNGVAIIGENDSLLNISQNNLGEATYNSVYTLNGQCISSNNIAVSGSYPFANFLLYPGGYLCAGDSAHFYNQSAISTGIIDEWQWDFGDGSQGSNDNNPTHLFVNPGTYNVTLTVYSAENCMDSVIRPLIVYETPIILTGNDIIVCPGESAQLEAFGGANYWWAPQDNMDDPYISNPTVSPEVTTTYTVNANNEYCADTATQTVTIADLANLDFEITLTLSCDSINASIINNSSGEDNFTWDFGDGTISTETNPVHEFAYGNQYTILLTANTCHTTFQKSLSVIGLMDTLLLLVPNIITPNDDNINDCFSPQISNEFSECSEINIYNRWGQLVFKKDKGEQTCWDGKNKSDKTYLDAGTYFYVLKVNDLDIKRGTITLIRN
jgi:gliding motility-associated-like protein